LETRQITRQELVAAALKLGARPGTIRQWFHRAIPYRWQIRLMEYFEGSRRNKRLGARGDSSNRQTLDRGSLA
jgi:hypothetical protein